VRERESESVGLGGGEGEGGEALRVGNERIILSLGRARALAISDGPERGSMVVN
jgi:hypothetical protein